MGTDVPIYPRASIINSKGTSIMNTIFAGIAQLPLEPLMYACAIAWGYISIFNKFKTMRFGAAIVELLIFTSIFMLHGGTIAGGFAASLASPLIAWVIFKSPKKPKPSRYDCSGL
jgi:hypothetical protein